MSEDEAAIVERTPPYYEISDDPSGDRIATVHLSKPLQVVDAMVTTITLHEPTAKDFESMDQGAGDIEQTNRLIAAVARIPYANICTMRGRDWMKVGEALSEMGFSMG